MSIRIEDLHNNLQNLLENFLEHSDPEGLRDFLNACHPAELVILLKDFSKEKQEIIFRNIKEEEKQQEVLMFAEGDLKAWLFSLVNPGKQAEYITEMPPDEAVDLIEGLPEEATDSLMNQLDDETARELKGLREYEEGTAGALMTPDFLSLTADAKLQHVVKIMATRDDLESINTGFVLTDKGKILGSFSVPELLIQQGNPFVIKFLNEDVITVYDTDDEEEAYQIMARHGLDILPVVDHGGQMKGIITADDMLDVARNLSDQDFYQMVGTSGDPTAKSVFTRAFHRIPWLVTTLAGGLVSGMILRHYNLELSHFTVLVIFMPFVIAMAGNVGVQSATIIVRELVNQESTSRQIRKDTIKEILTGMLNAFIFACMTAILILAYCKIFDFDQYVLAPAISLGLMSSMIFAAFVGANIPLIFTRLNIDPAISSGPIITMTMDVIGLTIYLTVATFIFRLNGLTELHF